MKTLNKYATSEQITNFNLDDFGQPNDSFSSYWYGDFEIGCLWEYNSNKGWFCEELNLYGFDSIELLIKEIEKNKTGRKATTNQKKELETLQELEVQQPLTTAQNARIEELEFILGI